MERSENPGQDGAEIERRPLGAFGRIRNELGFEAFLVVIGFALAIGLPTKIMLAITFTCLKFAIPDWITGWLVLRHDPDRWHGRAVALLFVAMGFVRASVFAFTGLVIFVTGIVLIGGPAAGGQFAAVGFGTGFLCAYGFLAIVFPLAFSAAIISLKTNRKLDFAVGLTKLRRTRNADSEIDLETWTGLKYVGIASGVSLSISCIVPLIWLSNVILFLAAFLSPFVWMPVFWSLTVPRDSEIAD